MHVALNGYYWDVYELMEHYDPEMISDHLVARLDPNPTAQQKAPYAPENIKFFMEVQSSPYWSQATQDLLDQEVVNLSMDASNDPTNQTKWNALAAKLDIPDYVAYLATLSFTAKQERSEMGFAGYRAWRHPVSQKWHFIAWDGDSLDWGASDYGAMVNNSLPIFGRDLAAQVFLKKEDDGGPVRNAHPSYAGAFQVALLPMFGNSPTSSAPLSNTQLQQRVISLAGEFSKTLGCEAMRWGRTYDLFLPTTGDDRAKAWAARISHALFHGLTFLADTLPGARRALREGAGATDAGLLDANFPQ